MPKLPRGLSGLEVVKALSKLGFQPVRQRGSHVVLEKQEGAERWGCVVPMHKELKLGTLSGVLNKPGLNLKIF